MSGRNLKLSGGKKLRSVKSKIDSNKLYALGDAIKFLQDNKFVKFDETVDLVLKLGIGADQNVRGTTQLPHGTGKTVRVAAFVSENNVNAAKGAGADLAGLEDLIEDVKKGDISFDVCVATPDVMSKVSAIAKILGPKGLMPNPKLGTVGTNIVEIVKQVKAGQVEFCADKGHIVHVGTGKLSFSQRALEENIQAVFRSVSQAKPAGLKSQYITAAFIASTMGPSLKLNLDNLNK
jgi:large subunit ribosomal protein L1